MRSRVTPHSQWQTTRLICRLRNKGTRRNERIFTMTKTSENRGAVTMKNTSLAITFLAITAFAVGCKPAEDNSTSQQQLEKVKTETKADAQQMKDFAFAQKA